MYCSLVISCILMVASVTFADKFHLMQKSVPRKSFVKKAASTPDANHELVFAVKQRNLIEMDKLLIERSTPGNPQYQEWLTFDQVGQMTSNVAGADAVEEWLAKNNIEVTWKSAHSDYLKATAKISQWEAMLDTKFFQFEDHSRKGSVSLEDRLMHRAETYFLPESVKHHLHAVFNTVQVPPVFKPKYHKAEGQRTSQFKTDITVTPTTNPNTPTNTHTTTTTTTTTNTPTPTTTTPTTTNKKVSATDGLVTVSFLNEFYQINSNTGNASFSQSVFETAEESYNPDDLTQFQQLYNLPIQSALHPYGFNTNDCKVTDDDTDVNAVDCYEGNLDVQYIMGVSQQTATIYWYVTDNSTTDPFVAWVIDVSNTTNPPLVNSVSWGGIEQENSPDVMDAFNTEAMKLGIMGVTITVSSGDDGVASTAVLCNAKSGSADRGNWAGNTSWTGKGYFPSFPATSPYVTAVGATMGPESGNPEIACQSQLGGVITTGGGFSTYYPTPSWQRAAVEGYFNNLNVEQTPTSGYNRNGRAYPDVSMIGVWYQIVIQGNVTSLFGTSASSPVFAALLSLTNAARVAQGKPSVGFINPTLYSSTSSYFNDITSGENNCIAYSNVADPSGATCCTSGFYATPGWDPVTGYGSMNYPNVLSMFEVPEPSQEPTAAPTNPTTQPTASPTDPTATPTTSPTTTNPTRRPSNYPTTHPTRAPITTHPTTDPTFKPSTTTPTTATNSPSSVLTRAPSVTVTVHPTPAPTTAYTSPLVVFTSNITLTNLPTGELDTLSQSVVVQTTAQQMGVATSAVSYVGTIILYTPTVVPPNLRTRTLQTTGYAVIAVTKTQVVYDSSVYDSTTELYSTLEYRLFQSVTTGVYTTTLNNNAISNSDNTLQNANAIDVSSTPATVVPGVSSSDDSVKLDAGAIAGIVIGSLAFLAFLAFLVYYCRTKDNSNTTTTSNTSTNNPLSQNRSEL